MNRYVQVIILVLIWGVGGPSGSYGEVKTDELVANLEVLRLKSLEVRQEKEAYYMDVVVDIQNNNDRELRLRNGIFEFFIQNDYNPENMVSIGVDASYQGKNIYLAPATPKELKFSLRMGEGKHSVVQTLMHALNFAGKPSKSRYFFIKAQFDLGWQVSEQWAFATGVKVEWMFCPDMQPEFPLHECFPGRE